MTFQENCFNEHCILHKLQQIASAGFYYLSPLKLLCFIPDNSSQEEYFDLLRKNDMYDETAYYDDYNNIVALAEFVNYTIDPSSSIKLKLDTFESDNMKKSFDSQNCGYELFSYQDEIGYNNRDSHNWLLEKIEELRLNEDDLYSISVDNLNQPSKIYIYRIDSSNNSRLVYTYNIK